MNGFNNFPNTRNTVLKGCLVIVNASYTKTSTCADNTSICQKEITHQAEFYKLYEAFHFCLEKLQNYLN